MNDTILAAAILGLGYVLPLLHVAISAKAGPWRPPAGARCPFGPRAGWLIMVLLLGPFGWLMFWAARGRRRRPGGAPAGR